MSVNNILQEDFYVSEIDENNKWTQSYPFSKDLNTLGNEGAFSFSADKEMAVFTACDREGRIGRCDLYLLIAGKTYNAGKIINSKEWDSQGCFSPDGKYLYFVSSRKGGYGGTQSRTNRGFTCMRWDTNRPHKPRITPDDRNNNFCRNPGKLKIYYLHHKNMLR